LRIICFSPGMIRENTHDYYSRRVQPLSTIARRSGFFPPRLQCAKRLKL
jgi:hypothetical protein